MVRMRARLARLLRPRTGPAEPHSDLDAAAREARIAAAHLRAWGARLTERARDEGARTAIVAALLATEQASARQEARAGAVQRSDGRPPLLH